MQIFILIDVHFSDCSTMTTVSESSTVSGGNLDEGGRGGGKRKIRGKKKKKKDRRKQHAEKCTKQQHRQSDLSLLTSDEKATVEHHENVDDDIDTSSKEVDLDADLEEKVVTVKELSEPESTVAEKFTQPISAMSTSSVSRSMKSEPVSSMSESASDVPVSVMSVTSDRKTSSTQPPMSVSPEQQNINVGHDEPAIVQEIPDQMKKVGAANHLKNQSKNGPIKKQEPTKNLEAVENNRSNIADCSDQAPCIAVSSPDSDQEMVDMSKYMFKWSNFNPLSPMSPAVSNVDEIEDDTEKEAKGTKSKLAPPRQRSEGKKKGCVKTLLPQVEMIRDWT